MTTQCVQVKLELGHKATIRPQQTTEGFTHDWTVFVRGPEGSNIQHFVERVVFYLHDSFPKPKRVVKEPPYQVIESGYAGFTLPIEVFFRSKEEPKKVQFQYDLFLHLDGPPINHIRCEKLTFQNPTEEFRRKLIRAGGGLHESSKSDVYLGGLGKSSSSQDLSADSSSVKLASAGKHPKHDASTAGDGSTGNPPSHRSSSTAVQHSESFGHTTLSSTSLVNVKPKHASTETLPTKNIRPTIPSKESNRAAVQSAGPPQSFVALFGQPIKTGKPSPDTQRLKDGHPKAASKTPKLSQPITPSPLAVSTGTVSQQATVGGKDAKNTAKETKGPQQLMVPGKDVARAKNKRSPSPAVHNQNATEGDGVAAVKKRKRNSSSTSSNTAKIKVEKPVAKEKKVVVKEEKVKVKKEKDKEKKEKHKVAQVAEDDKVRTGKKADAAEKTHVPQDKPAAVVSKAAVKKEKEEVKRETSPAVTTAPAPSSSSRPSKGKKRKSPQPPPPPPPPPPPTLPPPARTPSPSANSLAAPEDNEPGDASPGSSISLSSLHHDGSKGPLRIMMAEMDDDDDDVDRLLSPFSSDPESSPPHPTPFQRIKENSLPLPPLAPPPPPPPPQQTGQQTHSKMSSSMPPPQTVVSCEPAVKNRSNMHRKEKKVRDRSSSGGKVHKSSSTASGSSVSGEVPKGKPKAVAAAMPSVVAEDFIEELKELQVRITALRDRTQLQQIVNVIEETGLYKVTSTTFDFDLCTLDSDTVRKLQTCLGSV